MGPGECKVDKVTKAYGVNVQFTRHFHSKHTLHLMGHFVNHRHRWYSVELDTMDVKKKDGSYYSTERLLHTFANGNCGIFSITRNWGGRGNQYELRVKNGYNGYGKCYSRFELDTKRAGVFKKIKPCKNKR
nr:uncharacterized protein LOC119167339 [Rhipicephalus microplus]